MGTKMLIDMLAPDCDLDDINKLRNLLTIINKLDIPRSCETIIARNIINGQRVSHYIHLVRNFQ